MITESQLQRLVEQKMSDEFHVDTDGQLQSGDVEMMEPYEMAEKVADFLINGDAPLLHPDYYQNNDLYMSFVDALHDVLSQKMNNGEVESTEPQNPLAVTQPQLNESIIEMKKVFDKFK